MYSLKKNFIALTSYLTLKYNSWGKCSLNVQFSVKCTIQCNENWFWWYIGMKIVITYKAVFNFEQM